MIDSAVSMTTSTAYNLPGMAEENNFALRFLACEIMDEKSADFLFSNAVNAAVVLVLSPEPPAAMLSRC